VVGEEYGDDDEDENGIGFLSEGRRRFPVGRETESGFCAAWEAIGGGGRKIRAGGRSLFSQ